MMTVSGHTGGQQPVFTFGTTASGVWGSLVTSSKCQPPGSLGEGPALVLGHQPLERFGTQSNRWREMGDVSLSKWSLPEAPAGEN